MNLSRRRFLCGAAAVAAVTAAAPAVALAPPEAMFTGKITRWNGFAFHDDSVDAFSVLIDTMKRCQLPPITVGDDDCFVAVMHLSLSDAFRRETMTF